MHIDITISFTWIVAFLVALIVLAGVMIASLNTHFSNYNRLKQNLRRSEEKVRRISAQSDSLFNSASGISIMAMDLKGEITLFNKGAELLLGYKAEEVIGKLGPDTFHDTTGLAQRSEKLAHEPNRRVTGTEVLLEMAKGCDRWQEWTYLHKNGTAIIVNLYLTRINLDGISTGYMVVAKDITERIKVEEALRETNVILQELSFKDGLTGISNRRHFDESLEREWSRARRHSSQLSLILIDIDFFKRYNDRYGHQAGDECLRLITTMLKALIQRKTDVYARYGGEEFALILPDTDLERATGIAELVRLAVEACRIKNAHSLVSDYITISAGVATINLNTMNDINDLIAAADSCLYAAKQEGRNRVISEVTLDMYS